jgi:preprotein translocase subunit SecA
VRIKEENQTLATITLQNYFRPYKKLAGMTGTAETEAAELMNTYNLQVVPIPTNKPLGRDDRADLIYKGEDAKFDALAEDIESRVESGQPVLVGTISVEKSEKLSRILDKRGVRHEVLNAKQHTREAEVVAQAGAVGAVTVATNMAGRGVDIILGGNPEGLAERECRAEGLEPDTDEYDKAYATHLARYTEECEKGAAKVREAGGLFVLGTERHDSRRIDNQLRGRAGRQGDPGESRFYLSLEDELMRLFATGAIQMVMGKNWPDDQPIEAKMVSKAIERAQNTVEQRNAEIRKNVLKYDEVMNEQRKVIYGRRDQVLDGSDLSEDALGHLAQAVDDSIATYCGEEFSENWDVHGLHTEILTYWPTEVTAEALAEEVSTDGLYDVLMADATRHYTERETELGENAMREVERQVMLRIIDQRWRDHLREMDYLQDGIGLRAMGQKDPLVEWQREGFEMFEQLLGTVAQEFVKYIMHVQVVVEDQKPAVSNVVESGPTSPSDAVAPAVAAASVAPVGGGAEAEAAPEPDAQTPVVKSEWEKVGRNEPCPCGSGKKYKMCHGR